MNNTFPVCKNCFYSEIPTTKEPCADCQIHFAYDRSKPHFKSKIKPTNADRIRAMSDEELAEWISCNSTGDGYSNEAKDWLDWLKQEVDT